MATWDWEYVGNWKPLSWLKSPKDIYIYTVYIHKNIHIYIYIGHPKKDLFRMPRNGHDDMSRIGISSCRPEMSAFGRNGAGKQVSKDISCFIKWSWQARVHRLYGFAQKDLLRSCFCWGQYWLIGYWGTQFLDKPTYGKPNNKTYPIYIFF